MFAPWEKRQKIHENTSIWAIECDEEELEHLQILEEKLYN
jgi:hypothetical protein